MHALTYLRVLANNEFNVSGTNEHIAVSGLHSRRAANLKGHIFLPNVFWREDKGGKIPLKYVQCSRTHTLRRSSVEISQNRIS